MNQRYLSLPPVPGRFPRRAIGACVALILLALFAGCGSDAGQTSSSPTDTPSATVSATTTTSTSAAGVDACGWFSLNDASQVLGGSANPPSVQKITGSSLCTYASPSNGETLLFVVQQGPNVPNRFQLEQQASASAKGYQVITGLGDKAFWAPVEGIVVLKGQALFTAQVLHVQSQAEASLVPAEERLIRTALSHLR